MKDNSVCLSNNHILFPQIIRKDVIMKNKLNQSIIPCTKCPYKLGIVKMLVNPCQQCKLNNYSSYKQFIEQMKRGAEYEH